MPLRVEEYGLANRPRTIGAGCKAKASEIRAAVAARGVKPSEARLRALAREFESDVERRIGADRDRPVPTRMPGKEVLDLVREGKSISRDLLLQQIALHMKAEGYFPPALREPLARIGLFAS